MKKNLDTSDHVYLFFTGCIGGIILISMMGSISVGTLIAIVWYGAIIGSIYLGIIYDKIRFSFWCGLFLNWIGFVIVYRKTHDLPLWPFKNRVNQKVIL